MDFKKLLNQIHNTHQYLNGVAAKAINTPMTIRNWLIGYYIVEFEQKGEDRAAYGENLIVALAERLKVNIKGISATNLRLYRQFYSIYPELTSQVTKYLSDYSTFRNYQTTSDKLVDEANDEKYQTASDKMESADDNQIYQTVSEQLLPDATKESTTNKLGLPPARLLSHLSFSHIVELIKIDDELKRAFYELECVKGVWSVRELKRQIESLYFERSGLSKDKEKLSALVKNEAIQLAPENIINTPYTIEFLGLNQQAMVLESDLEQAIIDHLINFLRELGQGFCFEDRQKKILIDEEYHYIDLVFYHRILKCHVLIDLKTEKFKHRHAGQINAYLNYYKKEVMQKNDNPPIGILLCTDKGNTMVKYATAGLDENIFVQKYMIALPSKDEIEAYIKKEMK
jgi:predicted nuclease of restriction endonuclease-like (RecB) superfamily